MATNVFDRQKFAAFKGVDLSRKGSVDERISELVFYINSLDDYFTTSSCSGRIIVFEDQSDGDDAVKKKGCKWLYTSHSVVLDVRDITNALSNIAGDAVFKFEAFVLHVQCRTLECAQQFLCCAVSSGFRNSGISVGNKGKIIVAVRSTHGLEAPLSKGGNLLVPESYWTYLIEIANKKMEENFKRIDRFFQNIKTSESKDKKTKESTKHGSVDKSLFNAEKPRTVNTSVTNAQDSTVEDLENCFIFGDVT